MPTIKQKIAFTKLVGNGGNVTKAMTEAKYAPATANTPQKLTESKGFQELLQENLPEDLVTKRHLELLNSGVIDHYEFFNREVQVKHGKGVKREKIILDDEEIKTIVESVAGCKLIYIKQFGTNRKVAYFSAPDNRSRKDAIDMAYKLRGNYAPEKSLNVNLNKTEVSPKKSKELVAKFNEILKKNLAKENE